MFRKGVWLIIAGILLLGHTPGLADSYLRVRKKGVTYYYFDSRKAPPSRKGKIITPHWKLPPAPSIRAASWKGEALSPGLLPRPDLPGTAAEAQVIQPPDAQVQIWAGARYFMGLLSKLGYRSPLPLPASRPGPGRLQGQQNLPASQELATLAPERSENLHPDARPPQAAWSQRPPSYAGSGQLLYCFPVAGHFSFRDDFADYRSGGRLHRAIDIFAPEGTPVYAITSGVIHTLAYFPGAGLTLLMRAQDGKGYGYMHLMGYASGIVQGRTVRTGELLGYVGHTGTLNSPAHLHFQVYADHRLSRETTLLNPYHLLVQLCHGVGVTDLHQPHLAYLPERHSNLSRIQVYRRRIPTIHLGRADQRPGRGSSILVIRNY
jgi:murein DD-endopeptidase MepM/ murein hydrolase activator NlpD